MSDPDFSHDSSFQGDSTSQHESAPQFSPGKAPDAARAVTQAQLARYVGVSPAAVSVALNNTSSRIKVSEATRQRIVEAARELGYQPNILARSLMKRQINVIGFCSEQGHMMDPLFPFLGALLEGMLAGCREHAKNLLMYSRVATVSENDWHVEVLNGQLDGLVLFAYESSVLTRRLVESHLPVITVADAVPGLPVVGVDDEAGGRLLARYLAERGHKRALLWAPSTPWSSSIERRQASYLGEAFRWGLQTELYREEHPYQPALEEFLSRREPPDVISVYCDHAASGVLETLAHLGVRVPQDVAVTGFDGVPGSYPTLTTVRAPWKQVAQTAVTLLVEQCQGHAIPMTTTLPVELVIRETA